MEGTAVKPKLSYAATPNGKVDEDPCGVVPLIGYVHKGSSDTVRLYGSRVDRRRYVEIPVSAIMDQTPFKDQRNDNDLSVLWVERTATLVECEAVLASSYESQAPAGRGEEDLAYRIPR